MDNLNKQIELRISMIRNELNLSRKDISDLTDISERFIYDIESGKKGMSVKSLIKISKSLKVSPDYLLMWGCNDENVNSICNILSKLGKKDLISAGKMIREFYEYIMKKED